MVVVIVIVVLVPVVRVVDVSVYVWGPPPPQMQHISKAVKSVSSNWCPQKNAVLIQLRASTSQSYPFRSTAPGAEPSKHPGTLVLVIVVFEVVVVIEVLVIEVVVMLVVVKVSDTDSV